MCNCGKKRMDVSNASQSANTKGESGRAGSPMQTSTQAGFQYTGNTGLTVIGKVTGTQYRFDYPGNIQIVDHRDIPAMMSIPVLKKMR